MWGYMVLAARCFLAFFFPSEGARKLPFGTRVCSDERHHIDGFGLPRFKALFNSVAGLVACRYLFTLSPLDGAPSLPRFRSHRRRSAHVRQAAGFVQADTPEQGDLIVMAIGSTTRCHGAVATCYYISSMGYELQRGLRARLPRVHDAHNAV